MSVTVKDPFYFTIITKTCESKTIKEHEGTIKEYDLILLHDQAVHADLLFLFGLAFSASDPKETYEISEVYVKTGYGRSSVYMDFDKVRAVLFTPKYIELWGKTRKMRVYVPPEDSDFIKDFIHHHLPPGCDLRYE